VVESAGTSASVEDSQKMEDQITILETSVKTAIDEDKPSPRIESMLWRLFNEVARSCRQAVYKGNKHDHS